jgi:Sulfotransferase family
MARNCLVLGCGRSGTSLTAGLLAGAGYFMGDAPVGPGVTEGNPKGQFEDPEINGINEDLLGRAIRRYRRRLVNKLFHCSRRRELRLRYSHRWLAALPPNVSIPTTPELAERIRKLTTREPFCFKDPRFSYTLKSWRPFVRDAVLICVFRHPAVTAASIVTECRRREYLHDLAMDTARALRVWEHVYRYILKVQYPAGGNWLFIHYDQVMDGSARERIERALGVTVDQSFPEAGLRRSQPAGEPTPASLKLYCMLADLAGCRA